MGITKDGLFKYQELSDRQRKNIIILETIRKRSPISKADLGKMLGYNIVTLSNYIKEYIDRGVIDERGTDVSTGGRKPMLIELNKNNVFLVGVDFGRDTISGVVTNGMLEVVKEVKRPRPRIEQEDVQAGLIDLLDELIKSSKVEPSKIRFIGIGTYGSIGESSVALKGLDEEKGRSRATIYFSDLKSAIEKKFNIITFFGQDAAFAAFGERAKNPDADCESLLYMFQDIGKGVVIKGEIYCSTDLGSIDLEGIVGNLSNEEKTKLKEESSYLRPWNTKMSLRSEAIKIIESGVGTRIVELLSGNLESLNNDVIIKAASENDEIAIDLIEGIGINLGVRISYLINLFSPKVVIVGGGIEKAGDFLFKQIEKTVEKLSLKNARSNIRIVPSILGCRAVSLGAAAVGLREMFLEA